MSAEAKIVLTAEDKTRAAFASAKAELGKLAGQAEALNAAFGTVAKVFGSAFAGITFTQFIRQTVNGLDALNDLKDATGASIENISALEDVAARTGTSFEGIAQALTKFNKALNDATPGSEKAGIFKQIGLDAAELRKIDPAEALRQTAVALSAFADDGSKARIISALLGKNVQEVAKFLHDLAEQSSLVAKVTTEEADAAKKFNDQLDSLAKNSTDLARAVSGPLIVALSDLMQKFNDLRKAGGFWKSIKDEVAANLVSDKLRVAVSEFEDLQKSLKWAGPEPARIARMAELRVEISKLSKEALAASDKLKGFANAVDGGVREGLNTGSGPRGVKPSIGDILGADKPKAAKAEKPGISAIFDRQEAFRVSELMAQATVEEALRTSELTEAEKKRADGLKRLTDEEKRLNDMLGLTKLHEQQQDMLILAAAFDKGTISAEQFTTAATERLQLIAPAFKEAADEMTIFAEQAARNIQDALGDTIERTLTGNFDNIAKMWGDMLIKMASQALAADLAKLLFGGTSGKEGGIGGIIGAIGFDLLSARAAGGPVTAGTPYLVGEKGPELFMPRSSGTIIPNGQAGGIVFNNVYNVGAGTPISQVVAAVQAGNRQVKADILRSKRRGGVYS